MRKLTFALSLAFLALGCGDDAPTEPEILNIEGTWSYSESFSSSSAELSCQADGTIAISQDGSNFTGSFNQQGVCTDSEGTVYDNSGSGTVEGGHLEGNQALFSTGSCDYTGTSSGNPPDRVSGSVSCIIAVEGANYDLTGTWTATR